ncbi:hypothetical protein MUN84_18295 [Hymenobacter sp. 5516J-16]|uniref:Uncharacterized protein n=1 Tax=Hymenobacter sublimis TaxID=2933777 RepID=A0ABY4JFK8_9BACT|nr:MULTISPECIES: hypothetical protein [Hymenobacter]UOQ76471.1 hypothetical protein MUN84_18295 [Hymenobacter sp. 5516J-16]UPL50144.1 hypothetical protein MWH26_04350 [Hymenobacter sublimis]
MKAILPFSALTILLATASCSQDTFVEKPREYRSVSNESGRRPNDKSQFKRNHNPIGLGLDLNSRNPYKFRMVDAPKRYKYSKGGR